MKFDPNWNGKKGGRSSYKVELTCLFEEAVTMSKRERSGKFESFKKAFSFAASTKMDINSSSNSNSLIIY